VSQQIVHSRSRAVRLERERLKFYLRLMHWSARPTARWRPGDANWTPYPGAAN
jgi:hypothetical protein